MEILIPDAKVMMYRLDEIRTYSPNTVYICQIVLDRLQADIRNTRGSEASRKSARAAVDYIYQANLRVLPDPDPNIYDLCDMDNRHSDEMIIASCIQLLIDGVKIKLHVSNEHIVKRMHAAVEKLQAVKGGDFSHLVKRANEYQQNKNKKKKLIQSGQTGLAKTRDLNSQYEKERVSRFDIKEIGHFIKRTLISLAVLVVFYFILQSGGGSAEKEEAEKKDQDVYKIEQLAFENIEIKLVEVERNSGNAVLRYEMINRNADPIKLGAHNKQEPIDGKKEKEGRRGLAALGAKTIKFRYKDDIVDYSSLSFTLEPNQIEDVSFLVDGSLEDFIGIDTWLQNEKTGEFRKWTHNF